jgi:hypothetical protein
LQYNIMFSHPRLFFVALLLSVSATAAPPSHASGPLVNLNVVVLDAAAKPIAGARLTVAGEVRRTDGGGFVNFAVAGPVLVDIAASGYASKRVDLPPGNHRVHLIASRANRARAAACGPRDNPTENRLECAQAIAAQSANWRACASSGDDVACHRYAREVAAALAGPQRNQGWGWGLISKPRGQRQCSLIECGPHVRGAGYAEDAIAYLPQGADRKHWIGFDIVGGAGATGASVNWNGPLPRREDNLWVPVP